ncbi:phage tail protein I [Brevundimonas sp.]|uniref:phage tail protein I n=1 Tax=Brevundimonas sp. TaxID=1871086 RepID=UPI0025BE3461|nr:phage tail protein I [Brevundimonas sp.]MCG2663358.1 phage tail protein I [Brevundimonas sp.]
MKSLLPSNSTPAERTIEGLRNQVADLDVPIRHLWNAETCPAAFLPWLAWAMSVDTWRSDWPEQTKRDVIAASARVHRLKGTVAAVRSAAQSVAGLSPIALVEWFQPGGSAQAFTAHLDVDITDAAGAYDARPELPRDLIAAVEAAKPLRSRVHIGLTARPRTRLQAGGVIRAATVRARRDGAADYVRPFRSATRAAGHLRKPLIISRIDMDGAIVRTLTQVGLRSGAHLCQPVTLGRLDMALVVVRPMRPVGLRGVAHVRKPLTIARVDGDGRLVRLRLTPLVGASNLRTPAQFASVAASGV